MKKIKFAVFVDSESRDRAMKQFAEYTVAEGFGMTAVGAREIKFNQDVRGDDDFVRFYERCVGEYFVIEERNLLVQKYVEAIKVPAARLPEDWDRARLPTSHAVLLGHAKWMLENMPDEATQAHKFHRWLGFVQALLMITRACTLTELRDQTRDAEEKE